MVCGRVLLQAGIDVGEEVLDDTDEARFIEGTGGGGYLGMLILLLALLEERCDSVNGTTTDSRLEAGVDGVGGRTFETRRWDLGLATFTSSERNMDSGLDCCIGNDEGVGE